MEKKQASQKWIITLSIHFLVMIILIVFIVAACGQNTPKSAQKEDSAKSEETEKVPEQLTSIEESIEKSFKTLGGPAVELKEGSSDGQEGKSQDSKSVSSDQSQSGPSSSATPSETPKGQQLGDQSDKQSGDSSKQSSSGGDSQGGASQGSTTPGKQNQPSSSQPTQKPDMWSTINPIINTLHYQWNNFMPIALQKGANMVLMDNFSNSLNNLTNAIGSKNKMGSLLANSALYAYIPEFYQLYKSSVSPQIKSIRHYSRTSLLNSMVPNWTLSENSLEQLKSHWALYKTIIPKELQTDSNKMDMSILEFEKVIKAKDKGLSEIKGNVLLENVKGLEKALNEIMKKSHTGS